MLDSLRLTDGTTVAELRESFSSRPVSERVIVATVSALAVLLTASTLAFAWFRPFVRVRWANVFLGLGLVIYYLNLSVQAREGDSRFLGLVPDRYHDHVGRIDAHLCVLSALAAAAVSIYVEMNFTRLFESAIVVGFRQTDIVVGLIVVALVIDATRRAYGWAIALVGIGSVVYALVGPVLPGFLSHSGFSLADVATYGAVRISGAYGFITEIGSTWVAVFIMFAGLARVYGALDVILGLGQKLGRNLKSGVVHVAVLSSMAMGSITGSAAANAATTGSFTIPMMKEQGVRSDYAGAIESVASSGGQIMPPVMGVAAFLMADILGVSYFRVIQAAFLPALLFYFSVGIAIQFAVLRHGWTTERATDDSILASLFSVRTLTTVLYTALTAGAFVAARDVLAFGPVQSAIVAGLTLLAARLIQAVALSDTATDDFVGAVRRFFEGTHFLVPMAVLLYTLVVMRLSPLAAGLYTTLTMIGTMYARNIVLATIGDASSEDAADADAASRDVLSAVLATSVDTLRGFKRGSLDMAPLVGVLASMGVIISMLTQTGLTQTISLRMISLGGGVLVFVLLIAMVCSILFGMGMPTPAAYILVQALITPALVDLGVGSITAHLYVFYFAMLSAITPPVAVGVAVGSRIADSSFMQTAMQSLRIGAAGFLIPFALVVNPALIDWTLTGTPLAVFAVFLGVVSLTASTIGHDGAQTLTMPRRAVYLALAALCLFGPATETVLGSSAGLAVQAGAAVAALALFAVANVRGSETPTPAST
ncbi:TRAP transporter fused permease subunit [Salarchaeum sp. III]|uniref:TRAP transporter permease n=1 Tax=Salarchaeum sp. III TaxID=3107927 RepID=UPI002ED89705